MINWLDLLYKWAQEFIVHSIMDSLQRCLRWCRPTQASLVTSVALDRNLRSSIIKAPGSNQASSNWIKRTPFHGLPQFYGETLPSCLEARHTGKSRFSVFASSHDKLIFRRYQLVGAPCEYSDLSILPTIEFLYLINFYMVVGLWTVGSPVFTDLFLLCQSSGGSAESAGH